MESKGFVVEVDERGFESFIRSNRAVVVDFWGPSCAPCKMLAPIIEGMASEMDGRVAFGKVDVTKNIKLVSSMMIRSIPTLVFYKDGKKVKEMQGFLPKNRLQQEIKDLI